MLEDVVREQDTAAVTADETLGEPERLCDAARLVLVRVEEPLDAVLVAIAQQTKELAGMGPSGNQHQLVYTRLDESLNGVRHHRTVVQRQQMLVRDPRQRSKPAPGSAGENDPLHRRDGKRSA